MDRNQIKDLLNKHYSTVGFMAEIMDFRLSLARAHQLKEQGIRKPGQIGHESKEYGIALQDLPIEKVSEIELERILFELFPVTDLENIDSIDQQMPLNWFEETVVEEMLEAEKHCPSDLICPQPVDLGNENITFVNSENFDQTVLPYTEKTRLFIMYHGLRFKAHPEYHSMYVITPPDIFFTLPNRYFMTVDGHDFNFFRLHISELTKPLMDINHFAVVYNTNKKGQILSSIRHSQAKVYPNAQQLPGGKVDYGDTILRAAATEFCEEINPGRSPHYLETQLVYSYSYRHFQYGKPVTYVHVFTLHGTQRLQPQFNELCKLARTWKYEDYDPKFKANPAYAISYSLLKKGHLPHPSNLVPCVFDNDCELYRYDAPHKGLDWFPRDEIEEMRLINTGHGTFDYKFF